MVKSETQSKHADLLMDVAFGTNNRGRVKNYKITWGNLLKKLSTVHRTDETYADFMRMSKTDQDALKNKKGYWIAAYCEGGRRAKDAIRERSAVTFDIDYAPASLMDLMEM